MKSPVTGFGQRRYRTRLQYRSGWPELTALADILFLSLLFRRQMRHFASWFAARL